MVSNLLKKFSGVTHFRFYQHLYSLDVLTSAIITLGLIIFILNYNLVATHDGWAHLQWGYFWNLQFFQGNIFPKWFEDSYGGLGSPSFIFYPPLFRTIQLPFLLLNFSPTQQIRASYIVIILFNAIGVINLSCLLFKKNSVNSFIAVFLGIFNPYLFISIAKRGAAAEVSAIALIPWLMMGIYWVLRSEKIQHYLGFLLAFSLLYITHIPSAVTFVSSYFLSVAILLFLGQVKWQKILILLIIPLLSLLLSAWFFLPVILDAHLLGGVGEPPYSGWFILYGLLKFKVHLSSLGWEKSLSKTFLLSCIIVVLTAILGQPWRVKEPKQQLLNLQLIMVTFSLFMMTDASLWVYENVSVFPKIQFPWRFLTIASSLSPYLLSYTFESAKEKFPFLSKKFFILVFLTGLILINYKSANLYLLRFNSNKNIDYLLTENKNISPSILTDSTWERVPKDYIYITLKESREAVYLTKDNSLLIMDVPWSIPATNSRNNWIPFKASNHGKTVQLPPQYPQVEVIEGETKFSIESWNSGLRQLRFDNRTEVIVNLKTFYYPGWTIKVTPNPANNYPLMSPAQDGRIQLKLPSGIYDVKIYYRGTPAELVGMAVSLSMITIILFLCFKIRWVTD